MNKFLHEENLKLFRERLAQTSDEKQRQRLLDLIAEHEAEWLKGQGSAPPE